MTLRRFAEALLRALDYMLLPLVLPAALVLKFVRRAGVHRLPRSRALLRAIGVFPLRDHYYEPQFDFRGLSRPLSETRALPGLELDLVGQVALLGAMRCADELRELPRHQRGELEYYLDNRFFEAGDAEFLYQLIRLKKPRRIVEIGSGNSTLIAMKALARNRELDPDYRCEHTCIEPYEMPWLEKTGATILRQRVEDVGPRPFAALGANDLLFIDSSHVIRPQGDVLFEFLQLLPTLANGVIVHIHDIFTPRDYPAKWVIDEVRLWNEQYLLEALLSGNGQWRVLAALNHLSHQRFLELKAVCPYLEEDSEPSSFYIQKTN
jgi:hypothetical protein